MTAFKATIHNGQLQFDQPLNLPEGAQVEVRLSVIPSKTELRGMTEEKQGDTPEAIEHWIQLAESIPAPTMTDEEWEAWKRRRREDRDWEFAHAAEREQRLDRYFQ